MVTLHDVKLSKVVDFGELKQWEGTHADLLGKSFIVVSAELISTKYGEAYVCDIILLNDETNLDSPAIPYLMGSVATINQVRRTLEDMPYAAQVVEVPAQGSRATYYMLAGVDSEVLESFLSAASKK